MIAILAQKHRLSPAASDFRAVSAHRSTLITMPTPGYRPIERTPSSRPPFFDAVIVPSARDAKAVCRAADTARNAGSQLIVLASRRTGAADVELMLTRRGFPKNDYLVLDETGFSADARLPLRTREHPLALAGSDLSGKKNAGLIVARLMRWNSVLFVDDDVQSIERDQLRDAADLMAGADRSGVRRQLVGWAIDQFPDLSSVGHAHSYGTGAWRTFASGGAMALRCAPDLPFFPPVYNEDILLALEIMRDDPGAACVAGTVTQDRYDPFGDLDRVAEQEFGEVLVDGLHRAASVVDAGRPEYWRPVLLDRLAMLRQVAGRLDELGVSRGVRVVEAATAVHGAEWPALLAGFVTDWIHDLAGWRTFLAGLPAVDRLSEATAVLGLDLHRGRTHGK